MASRSSAKTKPNIRMVAERVQLSPATVSLALRGSESIAPETRARVLAAARELNYVHASRSSRQNPAEPATETAAPRHLLFLSKDFGDRPVTANPFYGEILRGAEQECAERGIRLTFTLMPNIARSGMHIAASLQGYDSDGALLVGAYEPEVTNQIAGAYGKPLVLVDSLVPGLPYDSVMADDYGGGFLATMHLIERGHRVIAVVVGDTLSPSFKARYRGYCAACDDAGLKPEPPTYLQWDRDYLQAVLSKIIEQNPRPTAIFCVSDAFAVFVMDQLRDFGLRVPDDISVVGFDDFPLARMAHPPLTTMHNHPITLGRIAVQRVLARLAGDVSPALNVLVTTQLMLRESTRSM